MKSIKYSIQFLLVGALLCASQPMQGMSYLKAAYNAAVNYWYGRPKVPIQEPLLNVQPVSGQSTDIPARLLQDFENITKALGEEYIGTKLANDKQFADSVSRLIKTCVENFSIVIRSDKVLERLRLIVPHKDAELFIRPCMENLQALIKFRRLDLLCLLMQCHDKKNLEQLIEPCIENFPTLITAPDGLNLISYFACYKGTSQLLAEPCRENFEILSKTSTGIMLLCELAKDRKSAELLTKPCIDNLEDILKQSGNILIQKLAKNPFFRDAFIQKITSRYEIEVKIDKALPTLSHFANHIPMSDLKSFAENSQLEVLLKSVIAKEQQLAEDYYTFVHGQRRELYLSEKIYTHLWQLKKRRSLQDFFFAHVKDLVESPEAMAYDKVQKNFILSHGNSNGRGGADARRKLLFMNYALFANSTYRGSCTAEYVLENENSKLGSTINIAPSEPFKMFGYQGVYSDALKKKIEALAQEYKDASTYGNLLFIAVPKHKIHKYVYLAKTGGPKIDIEIDGIGRTSDIRIIMDTLLNAPHKIKDTDQLEFCLVMMQHKGGLDPNTGIKIMPILSGDPKKLEELKKKEDELLAEITQKVEDFERREQALTRAAVLSKHMNGGAVQIQSRL